MFEIEKIFRFEGGHVLKYHDGKCSMPHGHSYILHVKLRAPSLISSGPKINMIHDFKDISFAVDPMIKEFFDHQWINDTLATDSPTAEFMAQWIYHYLKPRLPSLYSITLWETATSYACYYEE